MKYLSIDVETSGLDPDRCQVLEFAAVADDTMRPGPIESLPRLRCLFPTKRTNWEPAALAMHDGLRAELDRCRPDGVTVPDTSVIREWGSRDLADELGGFLAFHFGSTQRLTLAGKNVANFDLRFLRNRVDWPDHLFRHRVIDPAMWFTRASDDCPPDLAECLRRAGLPDRVSHRAMDDAEAVVRLVRKGLGVEAA